MGIDKIPKLVVFLLILIMNLCVYSYSANGDFILDDRLVIVDNPLIKDLRNIPTLFVTHVFNQKTNLDPYEFSYKYYRPFMTLSFALDYSIWKLNTLGYHLTNILVHSLNAFLVFCLLFKLFSNFKLALLTSILFSVHPFNVQTVCYITNRTELLVSLFTLATLIFYSNFLKHRNAAYFLISLLTFIFALLSREAAFLAIIPFIILIIGIKSKTSKSETFIHFVCFLGLLLIYLVLRLTFLIPLQSFPRSEYSLLIDILNLSNVLIEYLKLLIFPHGFHIFRTLEPLTSYNTVKILQPIFFAISLIVILIVFLRQKRYVLLLGISWFLLTLLYLLKFMYKVRGIISVEEQWGYLASVGFFIIISFLILSIPRSVLRKFICVFVIIGYSALAFIYTLHWKDDIGFYRYNLKFVKVYNETVLSISFTGALFRRNLRDEALIEANRICSLFPDDWGTYIVLGNHLYAYGELIDAEKAYKKALTIDKFCWQANIKLKQIATEKGKIFKPEPEPGLNELEQKIISHIKMGDFWDALALLEKEISNNPSPMVYIMTGITFAKIGANREAESAFQEAIRLEPNNKLALINLLTLYNNTVQTQKSKMIKKMLEMDKNGK